MIGQIRGTVVDTTIATIIVDVHGVGYLIAVPTGAAYTIGDEVRLYTHLAVRENALDLYGFSVPEELRMFEELIKLPKIGPKTALQILSQASLEVLKKATQLNDPTYLSKMSGIGKKSAEKIVAGLKDSLTDGFLNDTDTPHATRSDSDVLDALLALGYSQRDALEAVQKIPKEVVDTNAKIKHALKHISV